MIQTRTHAVNSCVIVEPGICPSYKQEVGRPINHAPCCVWTVSYLARMHARYKMDSSA